MKRILFLLAAVSLVGCASTSITKESASGDRFHARNTRWFWKSEGVNVSFATATNGTVTASAKIAASSSDAESLRGAVEGAVSAAIAAAKQP